MLAKIGGGHFLRTAGASCCRGAPWTGSEPAAKHCIAARSSCTDDLIWQFRGYIYGIAVMAAVRAFVGEILLFFAHAKTKHRMFSIVKEQLLGYILCTACALAGHVRYMKRKSHDRIVRE